MYTGLPFVSAPLVSPDTDNHNSATQEKRKDTEIKGSPDILHSLLTKQREKTKQREIESSTNSA
jgi:hypothetical protein